MEPTGHAEAADRLPAIPAPDAVDPSVLLELGEEMLAAAPADPVSAETRARLADWLDVTRRSAFLRLIAGTPDAERWLDLVLAACTAADYTMGALFRDRVRRTPGRVWLRIVGKDRIADLTLAEVQARVEAFARGLHSLFPAVPAGQPVAILAENSPAAIVADLACLTTGLVDVTIPADATGEQAAYILDQTEAEVLIIGSDRQAEKILPVLGGLERLRHVVQIGALDGPGRFGAPDDARHSEERPAASPGVSPGTGKERILSARELIERGESVSNEELRRRAARPRFDDIATLMYTSGTTGLPKGILFSHRNLVFKRFARALALPEIGEEDDFLCYLPLYHTFGRWFEMTGTLFWGATYAFMENPSLEALLDNLRRASPTVFISIPKKWIQLHERMLQDVPEDLSPRLARPIVEQLTGGRLRWGLSAAGFLDPVVFRFFQKHGIELMSGFGMTEATGGITMTVPGDYREGTVGTALPGIEVKGAEDGELLVRGPYVMEGYFGPDERRVDYRTEWFPTGDIVKIDEDGFVTIVDRKKDIYKNVKGQTIAPQRIESLFQTFGEVRQVFLVGDGREYNTILIHPNYDHAMPPLREMPRDRLREYLSGIVVSVNSFLAPYERVLDVAVLPRALSLEEEELTPKGTYRRKVVEAHFTELIEGMYRAHVSRLTAGPIEVRIPHWLLRDMGLTLGDILADDEGLRLARYGRAVAVRPAPGGFRLGDLEYEGPACADLETILRDPELWLGNEALVGFTGPAGVRRPQPHHERDLLPRPRVVRLASTPELSEEDRQRLEDALWREDRSFLTLHLAAVALLSADEKEGLRLVSYFENVAAEEDSQRAELARIPLRRAVRHPVREVRSAAFRALLPHGAPEMVAPTVADFLEADPSVLGQAGASALTRRGLPEEIMAAFVAFVRTVHRAREDRRSSEHKAPHALDESRTLALLRFLVIYATDHPVWFRAARQELTRWLLSREPQRVRAFARQGLVRLTNGFRAWLGPDPRLAVDPVSGREYGWPQVLRFDPGCDPEDRARIERALQSVPLIKEASFILSGGARISLAEIPPGGIRVRHLATRRGKAVYRLTVQTRQSGTIEIALNLVRGLSAEAAEDETLWLTRLGVDFGGPPLVEEMGGFWPELGIWTEEYVPGETVSALLVRMAAHAGEEFEDRLVPLWMHLAAGAVTSYLDFWNRTDRRFVPADPSPDNLIVPAHDYQEGSRLVSLSDRREFAGLSDLLRTVKNGIIDEVGRRIPALLGVVSSDTLFAAVLDIAGEEEGARLLAAMLDDPEAFARDLPGEEAALNAFLDRVRAGGYMPRRLASAIRRYHRWAAVNPDATLMARARTLSDLWDSYALRELEEARPETRVRLFRETVFAPAGERLRDELARVIDLARTTAFSFELLLREMSELVRRIDLTEEEVYFLARMTYAHLRPADTADLSLVEQGGTRVSDLVVVHRDHGGRYFRVRHATTPREVWALHQLFYGSGLNLRFRPGHQFLVAVEENNRVIGGLVYKILEPGAAHMEKIVVGPGHRRQGISEELMDDFFSRLRARGVRTLTTGFYRPQYFHRFNFQIDREHAGLVKVLDDEPAPPRRDEGMDTQLGTPFGEIPGM